MERIRDAPIHSNQILSLEVASLFTKVPTDEALTVIRDKLAASPLLEERTCIPIDNLIKMLTFCAETAYFMMGSDIYPQEEGLAMGLAIVTRVGLHIHVILRRNGIIIYITKAIYMAYIRRWPIHSLASSRISSDITWSRELNPTIYTVHNGERARQQITLPRCINTMHRARIQVICVP